MPLFEFICENCGKPFEELVRSSASAESILCPACGSSQVKKKISKFASKIAAGGSYSFGSSAASCSTGST